MTYRTGSKRGFTLIELLTAITILATASLFIFRAFFTSLGAIDQGEERLMVMGRFNNMLAETKLAIVKRMVKIPYVNRENINTKGRKYEYQVSVKNIKGRDGLYAISLDCEWSIASRRFHSKRDLLWLDSNRGGV